MPKIKYRTGQNTFADVKASDVGAVAEPETQGTVGQVLTSNGNGEVSWETPTGGSSSTSIHVGNSAPTDSNTEIWLDTTEESTEPTKPLSKNPLYNIEMYWNPIDMRYESYKDYENYYFDSYVYISIEYYDNDDDTTYKEIMPKIDGTKCGIVISKYGNQMILRFMDKKIMLYEYQPSTDEYSEDFYEGDEITLTAFSCIKMVWNSNELQFESTDTYDNYTFKDRTEISLITRASDIANSIVLTKVTNTEIHYEIQSTETIVKYSDNKFVFYAVSGNERFDLSGGGGVNTVYGVIQSARDNFDSELPLTLTFTKVSNMDGIDHPLYVYENPNYTSSNYWLLDSVINVSIGDISLDFDNSDEVERETYDDGQYIDIPNPFGEGILAFELYSSGIRLVVSDIDEDNDIYDFLCTEGEGPYTVTITKLEDGGD